MCSLTHCFLGSYIFLFRALNWWIAFFGSDWFFTQCLLPFLRSSQHLLLISVPTLRLPYQPNTCKQKNVCFWHFTIFPSLPSFKNLLKYNIFPKISVTGREALIPHTQPSTCKYYPYTLYVFFPNQDTLCTFTRFYLQCK